jgi:hypothetical protein
MQDPLGPGDDWFAARGPRGVLQEFIQTKKHRRSMFKNT